MLTILIFTLLRLMTQEKSIEVTAQEPIYTSDIKIDIVLLGWQTIKHNIYSNGIGTPENIPEPDNLYILKVSYRDTLFYSHPYLSKNNLLGNKIIMSFNFFQKSGSIYCDIHSASYVELNKTIVLRDFNSDFKELMKFYNDQIKKEE